ncbi:hypothetical protein CMV16_04460 [Peribacillus simplex]|nr:hypothetical protein CMV16_04460 [Peribacillus simplex]
MNGTSPLVVVCKKNGETHKTPFGINERCFMGCDRQWDSAGGFMKADAMNWPVCFQVSMKT